MALGWKKRVKYKLDKNDNETASNATRNVIRI